MSGGIFSFQGTVRHVVLLGSRHEAGSMGVQAEVKKLMSIGIQLTYGVGQKVVWKLGQKSEYERSENQASNRGKWGKFWTKST